MTDQDGPSIAWTSTRAPPCQLSVWDEAIPTRDMATIVYRLTEILEAKQEGDIVLKMPEDFPIKNLERFLTDSIDLTDEEGGGMSFYQMDLMIKNNIEDIREVVGNEDNKELVYRLRDELGEEGMKKVFLTHHRYIQRDHSCVYSIVKDTIQKRIIVSFRGSSNASDWKTNLTILSENMFTPKKIKNLMPDWFKEDFLVHRGFYDYLFNNSELKGKQRFDQIIEDITKILEPEYSIYVTGHSLGGALATVFAVKLAGSGSSFDHIPRPVTCITWAAPHQGTPAYRKAVEHLERQGYLRLLRIINDEDVVPAVAGFLAFRPRPQKHVGICLRLYRDDYHLEHSSRANFHTFLRNLVFKPYFGTFGDWHGLGGINHWHGLKLMRERFIMHEEKWKSTKINDLYNDETVVSSAFVAGNV